MKNIITKPALLSNNNKDNREPKQYTNNQPLFKKHNFFVKTVSGEFKAFSYEANYSGENIKIRIFNSYYDTVKKLEPSIDYISKYFISKNYAGANNVSLVVYEEFCEALFDFIVDYIKEDEELGE